MSAKYELTRDLNRSRAYSKVVPYIKSFLDRLTSVSHGFNYEVFARSHDSISCQTRWDLNEATD